MPDDLTARPAPANWYPCSCARCVAAFDALADLSAAHKAQLLTPEKLAAVLYDLANPARAAL